MSFWYACRQKLGETIIQASVDFSVELANWLLMIGSL